METKLPKRANQIGKVKSRSCFESVSPKRKFRIGRVGWRYRNKKFPYTSVLRPPVADCQSSCRNDIRVTDTSVVSNFDLCQVLHVPLLNAFIQEKQAEEDSLRCTPPSTSLLSCLWAINGPSFPRAPRVSNSFCP